jgi:metal-responsive CopG/Arc/MetJ family transcriptional regulator
MVHPRLKREPTRKIERKTETRECEKYAVWLDKKALAKLRRLHDRNGMSVSELIRRALSAYLTRR